MRVGRGPPKQTASTRRGGFGNDVPMILCLRWVTATEKVAVRKKGAESGQLEHTNAMLH